MILIYLNFNMPSARFCAISCTLLHTEGSQRHDTHCRGDGDGDELAVARNFMNCSIAKKRCRMCILFCCQQPHFYLQNNSAKLVLSGYEAFYHVVLEIDIQFSRTRAGGGRIDLISQLARVQVRLYCNIIN